MTQIGSHNMSTENLGSNPAVSAPDKLEDQLDLGVKVDPETPTQLDTFRYSGISGIEGESSYDLKAPLPSPQVSNVESLSERLFSLDHLKIILGDAHLKVRFSEFLEIHRPQSVQVLSRYLEMQKALSSIRYANALAETLDPGSQAASLDRAFVARAEEVVHELVNEALPRYITHSFIKVATKALVKEITSQSAPTMREMIDGLGEVYCMTDPSLPDNSIIYASEDFYRCTQYSREYAIGRNCRFLQGPKTSVASVQRLTEAMSSGTGICETILNYRRDGSPFMSLLMIAPLYDDKGIIRYFLGAQTDVTGFVEKGRGLDSFEKLLSKDRRESDGSDQSQHIGNSHNALRELIAIFDEADMQVIRKESAHRSEVGSNATTDPENSSSTARRNMSVDWDESKSQTLFQPSRLGQSGQLPGVFQNFLLVRPYPSLRIIFTSPSLRIPGLAQSKLLDRVGGSVRIRQEIIDAMSIGISVTARIYWLQHSVDSGVSSSKNKLAEQHGTSKSPIIGRDAYVNSRSLKVSGADSMIAGRDGDPGKPRWIHCTPLLGSDEKIGVWMVVLVENEFVTNSSNVSVRTDQDSSSREASLLQSPQPSSARSISFVGSGAVAQSVTSDTRLPIAKVLKQTAQNSKLRAGKLFRDYLKREGSPEALAPYAIRSRDGVDERLQRSSELQSLR